MAPIEVGIINPTVLAARRPDGDEFVAQNTLAPIRARL